MNWTRLQALVEALLSGDHTLVVNEEARVALLAYAYEEVSNLSEVLTNERDGDGVNQVRVTTIGHVKRPDLPSNGDSAIDVDYGLCFAVARFMASYVSKEKFSIHREAAIEIINTYNRKVYSSKDQNNGY